MEFWTTDVTTDVDVYVYGSFNGTTASGLLASRFDQSFAEPGYHYVQLDEPLALSAGQTVHIAVKFGNQSYIYPLACDADGPTDSGKSYVSTNGLSWTTTWQHYNVDTTVRARVSTDTELSVDDPGNILPGGQLPLELRLDAGLSQSLQPIDHHRVQPAPDRSRGSEGLRPQGSVVRQLVAEEKSAGTHQVFWDGRDDQGAVVPSGLYFCRADAGYQASSLKLVLLK